MKESWDFLFTFAPPLTVFKFIRDAVHLHIVITFPPASTSTYNIPHLPVLK